MMRVGSLKTRRAILLFFLCSSGTTTLAQNSANAFSVAGVEKSQAPSTAPNIRVKTIRELMSMIKMPTNPKEMLENVKLGLAEDLFLREDFFEDENMNKVFGVAKGWGIIWQKKQTTQKRGDYPYPIPPFDVPPPNANDFVQSGFIDWTIYDGEQRKRIRTVVGFAVTSFNVDLVQSVFGKPDEIRQGGATLPPPHGLPAYMPDPKTHPLGNCTFVYKTTDAKADKVVSFRTNGIGQVLDFQIIEEEV